MMKAATPIHNVLADPVTSHMRTSVARLHVGQTVRDALWSIRKQPPEGRIIYFYVVDEEDRLCGVVPTRRLLLAGEDVPITDLMVRDVVTVPIWATVLDACEYFILHRLLAFPVIDADRRILGVVDVELYTDELTDLDRREGNDELFQLIGVHITDAQPASSLDAFRSRFPWLIANIAGGLLAALLSSMFEKELQRIVALALFIPIVLALAESVSMQSVSLALQALRSKRPSWRSIGIRLRSELKTGLLLGWACGLSVALVALAWLGEWKIALCLAGGIGGSVTGAAIIGSAMPILLRLIHREPQVAAGPVALALTDMLTLLIYFSLARWLFA